jgi:1,2-diacylglycerol 3-beta-glucosyltransferase
MPANFWPESDSSNELDPVNSLLSDLVVTEDATLDAEPVYLPSRFQGRRLKAALILLVVWSMTIALHLVSWGGIFVLGLTTVLVIHACRFLFAKPRRHPKLVEGELPFVSVLVAAKNEEAVIGRLVQNLCTLEYPLQYEVWIIDDNSSDRTPELLAQLAQEYKQLKVFRRSPQATGGKSGALNQVLPLTKGEIIAVFDADAQVQPDFLQQVIPVFAKEKVGAIQMRKAIANAQENFWTQGQMTEMALDTYLQQQRIAIGGIGELRGNGQLVRRTALISCGGWNEETITDDLDLTIRLHLDKWDIECVFQPAVLEEGVTKAIALWHQRNRWAEGGYQRYLDYWDLILKNRMGTRKTWDLLIFLIIMYILPTAAIPDLLMAIAQQHLPLFGPITTLSFAITIIGMFAGLKQINPEPELKLAQYIRFLQQTLLGTLYMFHWIVVMSSKTFRMAIQPKRLKWVKTVHTGMGHGA